MARTRMNSRVAAVLRESDTLRSEQALAALTPAEIRALIPRLQAQYLHKTGRPLCELVTITYVNDWRGQDDSDGIGALATTL